MRRTITRGLALAAIGTLGLTGPAYAGMTTGHSGATPDGGSWYDTPRTTTGDRSPSYETADGTPYDAPDGSGGDSPGSADDPQGPADGSPGGADDGTPSTPDDPSITPGGPMESPPATPTEVGPLSPGATPTGTPTPTPTISSATPPPPAHVRLHVAITGVQSAGAGASLVRYTVRVSATGGAAHHVIAAISVRPHPVGLAKPAACHGGATVHCHLGDVRHARPLTFREHAGHATRRITVNTTVTSADTPPVATSMVLVLRKPPRHTAKPTAPHHAAPPATVTRNEPYPVTRNQPGQDTDPMPAAPPPLPPAAAPPPVTIMSSPDATQGPLNPALAQEQPAPPKPRLPVVAPRPGPNPTPDGAPVTVRPVADGHTITSGSGMPTRTIFGILAAAASFIGLVTALVLIRRRNET